MKAGIVLSISLGSALILALACGTACSPDQKLYGTWEGARDWKSLHLDNEEVARGLSGVVLDLKGDGTFVLKNGGFPFEGNWVQSGNTIDLRVETVYNRPLEQQAETMKKQAVFKVRYQEGTMYFQDAADTVEIELKKKTKPS